MDPAKFGLTNLPIEIGNRAQHPDAMMRGRLNAIAAARTPAEQRAALKDASEDLESVFVFQMLEAMRKTIASGGLIEKSNGQRIFESMLDEEWAKKLAAKSGPNSISAMLYRQLSRQYGLEESGPEQNDKIEGGPAKALQFFGPDVPSLKLSKKDHE